MYYKQRRITIIPKPNGTDLKTLIPLPINPYGGGLGEAFRPPVGGLGGSPPIRVFPKNDNFSLKSVTFFLSQ